MSHLCNEDSPGSHRPELGQSCLERRLAEDLNPWLLVAAVGPWMEGRGSLWFAVRLEEELSMIRTGVPASTGLGWGQGRAHKTSSAEPLINSHDKDGLYSL